MSVAPAAVGSELANDVLQIVGHLVAELGGGQRPPTLDDLLDRDLGIGSLERVELLLRLERTFGVRLPDSVIADAATPRDLVAAVVRAAPAGPLEPVAPLAAPIPPGARSAGVPAGARTLLDVLRWHVERTPDRIHIYLRTENGSPLETPITYAALLTSAARAACGLRALGLARGERVALMLRTERTFFETFLGTLLIGAVPVPLYPPVRADDLLAYTRRQQAILRNAGARVLVTFADAERIAGLVRSQVPSLETVTTPDRLPPGSGNAIDERLGPDDPALIQYTSGSTGDPKGVLLSHANILANIRAIGVALDVNAEDVLVSWLPLYHDMGLIGAWLGALYFGVPAAFMSPLAFLARPSRWLTTIAAHRATLSPSPNFGFDLAVRKIPDDELRGVDLGSWRLALNGSEMVSADTVERFTRRFAPYGFRARAMCPVYGLAEASVGLTMSPIDRVPRIDAIARGPFERVREIRRADDRDAHALTFVSCGRPLPGHDVRIVDAGGRLAGERVEGHVQFRGPSVTRGYFDNPAATGAVLHDGWMDSGDLGYTAGGELFVTGREKDLIIQAGRNICAQEIEQAAGAIAGIRPGCVAAFGVHDPSVGTERMVVVAEARDRDSAARERLRRAVRDRLVACVGVPPDVVVIADPRTVLKTPSGKIRRGAIRDAYLARTLGARRSAVSQRIQLVASAAAARAGVFARWLARVVFTGWILIVCATTLPILWIALVIRAPGPHARRAARLWSRVALAACGLRPRVSGLEQIRGVRPAILVANHSSYIDPVVLMAAIPDDFRFVAKRALTAYPVLGTVIRHAEHVTIDKAQIGERLAGAEEIARRLERGELLVIFPEGTFVRPPGLLPFRLGAFRAAVDGARPIVPIAIRGTRRVFPDGTRLFRHGPIDVTIGAPLQPTTDGWPEMVRLRDLAVTQIAKCSGEPADHSLMP